ncbi:two-component sensor histidine kinase, partial [Pseudomonas putida]|nr:two-component sensor histidine kinase [Pseudomonas putida]
EREQLNQAILLSAAIPVGAALLGILILMWAGIANALKPFERIGDALSRRDATSLEPIALAGLPSELVPLVASQNQLFLRIAQAIERERRFTGDAAHELRSPLTAIKTHLQIAQQSEGRVAYQAMNYAQRGVGRLHRTLEQ